MDFAAGVRLISANARDYAEKIIHSITHYFYDNRVKILSDK
jgi:hypothetical protein